MTRNRSLMLLVVTLGVTLPSQPFPSTLLPFGRRDVTLAHAPSVTPPVAIGP